VASICEIARGKRLCKVDAPWWQCRCWALEICCVPQWHSYSDDAIWKPYEWSYRPPNRSFFAWKPQEHLENDSGILHFSKPKIGFSKIFPVLFQVFPGMFQVFPQFFPVFPSFPQFSPVFLSFSRFSSVFPQFSLVFSGKNSHSTRSWLRSHSASATGSSSEARLEALDGGQNATIVLPI